MTLRADVKGKRDTWKTAPLTYDSLEAAVRLAQERLSKNQAFVRKLTQRGRERALIYRTLVLTGLRRGELASLTNGSLELDAPTPFAVLDASDEKNRRGSEISLRGDLVQELRNWVADKRAEFSGTDEEFDGEALFSVPSSLLRVLNRDLKVAGIPKTDERGRVIDLHAMRMTLATMLNKAGVAPRTAQEIMRHSDIRLTMETYTDPQMLGRAEALDAIGELSAQAPSDCRRTIVDDSSEPQSLPPKRPPNSAHQSEPQRIPANSRRNSPARSRSGEGGTNVANPTKKALPEGFSDKAVRVEAKGLEPSTSALRM